MGTSIMIDELREKSAQLQVNMELITLITSGTDAITKLCRKLVPNFVLNDEGMNYSFSVNNLDSLDTIKNKIADAFMLFSSTFFQNETETIISDTEKQYIRKIYYLMYKTDIKNNTFSAFEKEKLIIFNENVFIKELFNILKLLLSEIDSLKNLQNLETKKLQTSLILKKRKKALFFIEEIFNDLTAINNTLKEIIIFEAVKNKYKPIKNKIITLIKNSSLSENETILKAYLRLIEEHFNNNSIHIGTLFYIHDLLSQEKNNIFLKISVQEKKLSNILKYKDKFEQNSTSNYELKESVKKLQELTNEANKVFVIAKDPKTAIKHSEMGKELQLYFSRTNTDELNVDELLPDKLSNTTEILTPDTSDVKHWFKYGTKETNSGTENNETKSNEVSSISDLKTTSFGTSIKKLLSENGLDMNMIKDLYKKD